MSPIEMTHTLRTDGRPNLDAVIPSVCIAATEVIRPLPYLATKPPRVRDVLGEALRPMFGGPKP